MRLEIERKFLVAGEGWRAAASGASEFRDGLLGQFAHGKVRIRLDGDKAWITVKGARQGIARPEFEYEIPLADAEAMLANLCHGRIIAKTRSFIPHGGLVWTVDEFRGPLEGVVLAEVELDAEEQALSPPDWVGAEVTGDLRFRQSTMLHLSATLKRAVTLADLLALPEAGVS